jgi:toxin-antitoxin system PIN domain toxin
MAVRPALLDLNLLAALIWPSHEHHAVAHDWFDERRVDGWATCPLTQLGFVRLVSNPAFSRDALSVRDALTLLMKNAEHPDHVFWSADRDAASLTPMAPSLRGHQQVTDAYLLALAHHHGGLVATFDRGLSDLAAQLGAAIDVVAT